MGSRPAADTEGRRIARRLRTQLGEEIRIARTNAGLGQRQAAAAAGMSHAQLGRIERGDLEAVTVEQLCRAGMAVGLKYGAKLFPVADPIRDTAQLRLIERFVALLPPFARVDREVPIPLPGDLRAWDAVVGLDGRRAGCEAETRVGDVQALERKLTGKLRDGEVDVVILVLADSAHNRSVLEQHGPALRTLLPLDNAQVRRALREMRLPKSNGIVLV